MQREVVLRILLNLELGTYWYRVVNSNMKWFGHTRSFKGLGKLFDADNFILISLSTHVSGSRW